MGNDSQCNSFGKKIGDVIRAGDPEYHSLLASYKLTQKLVSAESVSRLLESDSGSMERSETP